MTKTLQGAYKKAQKTAARLNQKVELYICIPNTLGTRYSREYIGQVFPDGTLLGPEKEAYKPTLQEWLTCKFDIGY